jgi:hypothetical protein
MSVKSKQPEGFGAPKGIKKTAPTEGSKTQKRKAGKSAHMGTTAQFR